MPSHDTIKTLLIHVTFTVKENTCFLHVLESYSISTFHFASKIYIVQYSNKFLAFITNTWLSACDCVNDQYFDRDFLF